MVVLNNSDINSIIGYYTVIQYSPDYIKLPPVNMGIVLLVPEKSYIKPIITHSLREVSNRFNIDTQTKQWLISALDSTQTSIKRIVPTMGGINKFISTRMNEIRLTELLPIGIKDNESLDNKLMKLYNEIVN